MMSCYKGIGGRRLAASLFFSNTNIPEKQPSNIELKAGYFETSVWQQNAYLHYLIHITRDCYLGKMPILFLRPYGVYLSYKHKLWVYNYFSGTFIMPISMLVPKPDFQSLKTPFFYVLS